MMGFCCFNEHVCIMYRHYVAIPVIFSMLQRLLDKVAVVLCASPSGSPQMFVLQVIIFIILS